MFRRLAMLSVLGALAMSGCGDPCCRTQIGSPTSPGADESVAGANEHPKVSVPLAFAADPSCPPVRRPRPPQHLARQLPDRRRTGRSRSRSPG